MVKIHPAVIWDIERRERERREREVEESRRLPLYLPVQGATASTPSPRQSAADSAQALVKPSHLAATNRCLAQSDKDASYKEAEPPLFQHAGQAPVRAATNEGCFYVRRGL